MTVAMPGMAVSGVAIFFLCLLSVRADRALRCHPRLPMQVTLDGRATWSLPRRVGLLVTPGIAALAMGLVVILAPAGGREADSALLAMAFCFPLAHIFHLWLAKRILAKG